MASYCPWDKMQTPFLRPRGWHDLIPLPSCDLTPHSSFFQPQGLLNKFILSQEHSLPLYFGWPSFFLNLSVMFSERTFLTPSPQF